MQEDVNLSLKSTVSSKCDSKLWSTYYVHLFCQEVYFDYPFIFPWDIILFPLSSLSQPNAFENKFCLVRFYLIQSSSRGFERIMFENGQTHYKNLAENAARFVKCVWPFWDIMHSEVKTLDT